MFGITPIILKFKIFNGENCRFLPKEDPTKGGPSEFEHELPGFIRWPD